MTNHTPEQPLPAPPDSTDSRWYFEVTEAVEELDLQPGMIVRWDLEHPDDGALVFERRSLTPHDLLGMHDLGKLRVKRGSPPTALLRRFYPSPEPGATTRPDAIPLAPPRRPGRAAGPPRVRRLSQPAPQHGGRHLRLLVDD